jgi:hypothetical protein
MEASVAAVPARKGIGRLVEMARAGHDFEDFVLCGRLPVLVNAILDCINISNSFTGCEKSVLLIVQKAVPAGTGSRDR